MKPKKEKPIAVLTINEDVSKMTSREYARLKVWLYKTYVGIGSNKSDYGKCRFRLMKGKTK